MKQRKHCFIDLRYLILAIVSSILLLAGCSAKKEEEKTESISDIQRRDCIPVRVTVAAVASIQGYELLGGTAEGYMQTTLSAGVPGKISKLNVKVGDNISQEASLMTIEPDIPQNYDLVKQQYENALKSQGRIQALAEQGGVSQQIIDDINTQVYAAKEGLESVRKSQFVLAPFSGTVVSLFQMVNSKVGPGAELAKIAKINNIRIPIVVSDIIINKFKAGQTAYAMVGSDTLKGSIEKVALAGAQGTHTFIVEAVFKNPRRVIKPAMYVPVKVITENRENAITLPMDAIISEGAQKYVYLISNETAVKSVVTLGIRSGDIYEVVSGVQDGDQVVVNGSSLLADGSKVNIVD